MNAGKIVYLIFILSCLSTSAQTARKPVFRVIPLGIRGGLDESNLSCYMVGIEGKDDYVCLDAGTIYSGLQKAVEKGIFRKPATDLMKRNIRGYLITHGHLDHVAGLIMNSPEDSSKNIYGLPSCLEVLQDKYFTWKSWANFADAGERPQLKKYHYVTLAPGQEIPLQNTSMQVKAFVLSHGSPYESTAFLLRQADDYLLYLGDTGADTLEKSNKLQLLWQEVAPLIKEKKLRAIFIEVSFSNEQPMNQLFGHLTPHLFMKEMHVLESIAGAGTLKGLPVVITHIKPSGNREQAIKQQVRAGNDLGLKIIFPQQAGMINL